jgi:hypothetical protein
MKTNTTRTPNVIIRALCVISIFCITITHFYFLANMLATLSPMAVGIPCLHLIVIVIMFITSNIEERGSLFNLSKWQVSSSFLGASVLIFLIGMGIMFDTANPFAWRRIYFAEVQAKQERVVMEQERQTELLSVIEMAKEEELSAEKVTELFGLSLEVRYLVREGGNVEVIVGGRKRISDEEFKEQISK